jgi:putative tryptophan/tyrosine transport system substrate-binding protein
VAGSVSPKGLFRTIQVYPKDLRALPVHPKLALSWHGGFQPMLDLRRRDFITLLGGAAAWPLAARAQQPAKLPTIGFMGAANSSSYGQWVAAFVQRLRELGWIEGRTVAIEVRWAEGHTERLAEIAAEFVRLKVDVIVTHSAVPVLAAK